MGRFGNLEPKKSKNQYVKMMTSKTLQIDSQDNIMKKFIEIPRRKYHRKEFF